MKQFKLFATFLMVVLCALFITSCTKDDNNGSSSNDSNNLSTGQVEVKVYPDTYNNVYNVSFSAITQKITIDWGDGTTDNLTPNGAYKSFSHVYSNQNLQTIKVNTEGMTGFEDGIGYLQELEFGNCPDLTILSIESDKLTNLGVSKCTALTLLECTGNQLTSLDVSKCTALRYLDCQSCQLTSLDVSKCSALILLDCNSNQLTSLDVSKCTALVGLNCYGNQVSASALNALFNSLPAKKSNDNANIFYDSNPGSNGCDKTIATNKGWGFNLSAISAIEENWTN